MRSGVLLTLAAIVLGGLPIEPGSAAEAVATPPATRELASSESVGAPHPSPASLEPAQLAAFFDRLIPDQLAANRIPGAVVAVVKDDQLVYSRGYGYADLEQQTPVDADRTLFQIGSTGKLFTWTAVMQLAEQGTLDLDADVNTYLDFRTRIRIPSRSP